LVISEKPRAGLSPSCVHKVLVSRTAVERGSEMEDLQPCRSSQVLESLSTAREALSDVGKPVRANRFQQHKRFASLWEAAGAASYREDWRTGSLATAVPYSLCARRPVIGYPAC